MSIPTFIARVGGGVDHFLFFQHFLHLRQLHLSQDHQLDYHHHHHPNEPHHHHNLRPACVNSPRWQKPHRSSGGVYLSMEVVEQVAGIRRHTCAQIPGSQAPSIVAISCRTCFPKFMTMTGRHTLKQSVLVQASNNGPTSTIRVRAEVRMEEHVELVFIRVFILC